MARRRTRTPLSVYLNGRLVGQLRRQSSGAIDFQYDRSWLERDSAIPVSLSIPLEQRDPDFAEEMAEVLCVYG